jgi:hypothetical protein
MAFAVKNQISGEYWTATRYGGSSNIDDARVLQSVEIATVIANKLQEINMTNIKDEQEMVKNGNIPYSEWKPTSKKSNWQVITLPSMEKTHE